MTDKNAKAPDNDDICCTRRQVLKKAVYVAPSLIVLGTLASLDASAQSICDPNMTPLGCPPDPPGSPGSNRSPTRY